MGKNSLLNLYSMLISNWLNGGGFSQRSRLNSTDIQVTYNSIFTKTSLKQVFRVTGIKPDNIDLAFLDYIQNKMFELHPDIEVNFVEDCHPTRVSVTDEKFARSFRRATENYQQYKEAFEGQSAINRMIGKTYRMPGGGRIKISKERLDYLYNIFASYEYVYNYVSSGGTFSIVNIYIELIGAEPREVRKAGDDLIGLLGSMSIGCQMLKNTGKAYLNENGAASYSPKALNKKHLPQLLMSSENMAAFSTYKARGLVGGGKNAILFGMDFRSRLPFTVDIFQSGAAQVFMLLGKTGSGKSFTAFNIALGALAAGHHVSALDLKGREWAAITPFVRSKTITFDERNPSFVNTLRLDDLNATEKNAIELFNTAVRGTVQLFSLVINIRDGEGNPADGELVVREAVLKLYSLNRVDPANVSTFSNTKDIKYADVLPILEELMTTATYTDEQRNMARLARARLNAYFGASGMFADAFKNEITLGDVLDSPLVIYELNKNQNAMQDSLDTLRVFMIQFLDSKKKSALKERGEFMFMFYEELQRTESFGDLLKYICADVTGSRSNNAVIFLLLNSLKVLQGKNGQDIRSNITSYLVGYCEANDIEYLDTEFNQPWLAGQLRLFAEKQSIYRNCFAAVIDTGVEEYKTVFKIVIPDRISRKFRTRTIKDD